MPESQELTKDTNTKGLILHSEKTPVRLVRHEYSKDMIVWKEIRHEYTVEGLDSKNVKEIASSYQKNESEGATLVLASLTETALLRLVSEDKDVVLRSRAIEELLRRQTDALPDIIVKELERSDIAKAWRNTLLLVAEHVQFTNLQHQEKLRECLKLHARNMKSECHPRTQIALRSLLHIRLSLMVDWRDSLDLTSFLVLDYPIQVKRIALLGIQNLFKNEPPSTEELLTLAPVQEAIASIAKFFLVRSVYNESEDEFDLGLDALDTLFRLADPCTTQIVASVVSFADKWVSSQIRKTIRETRDIWLRGEFSRKDVCVTLLDGCIKIISDG
jgi:hypothetical protein